MYLNSFTFAQGCAIFLSMNNYANKSTKRLYQLSDGEADDYISDVINYACKKAEKLKIKYIVDRHCKWNIPEAIYSAIKAEYRKSVEISKTRKHGAE